MPTKTKKKKYVVPKALRAKLKAAVKYLTKHPDKIIAAWKRPYSQAGGDLFRYVHPATNWMFDYLRVDGGRCGCLTQIRRGSGSRVAYIGSLTSEIKRDKRLPTSPHNVTPEHLPYFEEWMLRLAVIFEWSE